jgi:CDP-diacylglycerol--glycerol-3-phosphate 3-phosphatidyltransferase
MNVANRLTILRIFLAFICVFCILENTFFSLILAVIFFLIAAASDYFDGKLARRYKLVSDLGKLLDPVADKILIIGVFLAFLQIHIISAVMVGLIMLREFTITGFRLLVLNRKVVLEAKRFGKHKTVSQIVGIMVIFLMLIIEKEFPKAAFVTEIKPYVINIVMWYVVIVTLSSGLYYLWANRKLIKSF